MSRTCAVSVIAVLLLGGCDDFRAPPASTVRRPGQPQVLRLADQDPALVAATDRARETLPVFVERLRNPTPSQTMVAVLARFADGEHAEHLWLTDIHYEHGRFSGQVANKPLDLTNIEAGARVQVNEAELRDWLVVDNGELLGGYTVRLLRRDLGVAERDRFDRQLGLTGAH